ncbi:hypothetical protein MKX07_001272 [Trichoderma sp. CBMAI-0711]|nr:hypothetical protein MKX07_001272 [Trichoderma sp. CBMAI-0711]
MTCTVRDRSVGIEGTPPILTAARNWLIKVSMLFVDRIESRIPATKGCHRTYTTDKRISGPSAAFILVLHQRLYAPPWPTHPPCRCRFNANMSHKDALGRWQFPSLAGLYAVQFPAQQIRSRLVRGVGAQSLPSEVGDATCTHPICRHGRTDPGSRILQI